MAYIGVQPTDTYLSIASQQITGTGSATYTLDYSVSNEEDVAVFVNNVRQNVSTYTVSSNQLTLGGTISASDSCWVLFLGRTVGTKTPAVGSVTNDMLAGSIANSKLANSSITLNGSAVSLGGSASVANTPAFHAKISSQTISHATDTKVQLSSEELDTDSAFDSSTNYRFTVPSGKGGNYFIYGQVAYVNMSSTISQVKLYKNGSFTGPFVTAYTNNTSGDDPTASFGRIINLSAGDYVEMYTIHIYGSNGTLDNSATYFGGYKLIT